MSRYRSSNNVIKSQQSTASLPREEVNVVLLGKQSVGKSALVVKYLTRRFICEYDPFLGKTNSPRPSARRSRSRFPEDTYWKPDVVDQQDVLVKVMDTYGKVTFSLSYIGLQTRFVLCRRTTSACRTISNGPMPCSSPTASLNRTASTWHLPISMPSTATRRA